jgi:hypothetical protein
MGRRPASPAQQSQKWEGTSGGVDDRNLHVHLYAVGKGRSPFGSVIEIQHAAEQVKEETEPTNRISGIRHRNAPVF